MYSPDENFLKKLENETKHFIDLLKYIENLESLNELVLLKNQGKRF